MPGLVRDILPHAETALSTRFGMFFTLSACDSLFCFWFVLKYYLQGRGDVSSASALPLRLQPGEYVPRRRLVRFDDFSFGWSRFHSVLWQRRALQACERRRLTNKKRSLLWVDSVWGGILHWWCSAECETSRDESAFIYRSPPPPPRPGRRGLISFKCAPCPTDHRASFIMLYCLIDSTLVFTVFAAGIMHC